MRAMKDSGVEWIGEIPEGWSIERIKHNANVINGATPRSDDPAYWDGTIVWVTPADMKDDISRISSSAKMITEAGLNSCGTELVPEHSVIISNRAPIGRVGLTVVSLCTNQGCKAIVTRSKTDPAYLCYYLFIQIATLNMLGRGTTFLELSTFDLANLFFPCPSKTQQSCIATFLDVKCAQIDAIIEKQQQVIEKLKLYKQSVITEAVTKGLDPAVPMKDSGVEWIGMVPEHWSIVKLSRAIVNTRNGMTRRDLTESSGIIVLKLSNITSEGNLDYSQINRIELSDFEIEKYILHDGDFLFVRVNGSKGLVGKCALFRKIDEPVAYNDHIICVSLSDDYFQPYVHWYLLSDAGKQEVNKQIKTAAGQYTISGVGLREIAIPFLSYQEQKYISAFLTDKCEKIEKAIIKKSCIIANLTAYKKSLIYEAVTGKREV
jgi:type I restriction enzyme S subunit